jgi:EAL domain-containing protein (putative c-di-GMP-specific phosphodiesterase class I)/ActR/RegA family two-component response regulator
MTKKTALRILVLDDEPFMLKLLGRMLENLGFFSVVTCESGLAALDLVDDPQSCPELILMDINMPQMDGIEFVRRLVEHRYAGALLLVSGEDERVLQSVEKLVHAHQLPVLGYLVKPVTPTMLAGLIDQWVPAAKQLPGLAAPSFSTEDLASAILNGELINYYQPKVNVSSGAVVGVEALVRWCHPELGMLYPDDFISFAENNGLIDDLTKTVLARALTQARVWRDAGYKLRVAVNLSMDNLVSLNFLEYVAEVTTTAGVAPKDMVLELTESRLMQDQRVPLEILARLRLKRFRLAIDDFGTGNSSLAQLDRIPFEELKIDRGFVHGAAGNDTRRAMFEASLGLARKLQMDAVAEGVEDQADWDFVRDQGCDMVQGYFVARPMLAEELPAWMADWELRRADLYPQ